MKIHLFKEARRFYRILIFCSIGLLSICHQSSGEDLAVAEGLHFDIVGLDRPSVYFVDTLTEHILLMAERYLGPQPESFPQRILVVLQKGETLTDHENYQLTIEPGGFVRVDFNWNKNLKYPELCRGLVDAYLARLAILYHGYDAPAEVKAWIVSALALKSYISLRPSVYQAWCESFLKTSAFPIPSFEETAFEKRGTAPGIEAFFFMTALRSTGFSTDALQGLCRSAVKGVNIEAGLNELISDSEQNKGLSKIDLWWEEVISDLGSQSSDHYDSLKTSEEWIRELSKVVDLMDSNIELKSLKGLWSFRNNEFLRFSLQVRLGRIAGRIERVNPVYLNAAQSLGVLYEEVLMGQQRHLFNDALIRFLGDMGDATRLHGAIDSALSEISKH